MPSATATRFSATRARSSFEVRMRPAWVAENAKSCSTEWSGRGCSSPELEDGIANPDQIASFELRRGGDRLFVQVGPVLRVQVLEVGLAIEDEDSRMDRGD